MSQGANGGRTGRARGAALLSSSTLEQSLWLLEKELEPLHPEGVGGREKTWGKMSGDRAGQLGEVALDVFCC